jgi:hypothetical protein
MFYGAMAGFYIRGRSFMWKMFMRRAMLVGSTGCGILCLLGFMRWPGSGCVCVVILMLLEPLRKDDL